MVAIGDLAIGVCMDHSTAGYGAGSSGSCWKDVREDLCTYVEVGPTLVSQMLYTYLFTSFYLANAMNLVLALVT